ncbi:hypothetical protein BGP82_20185 [Pseudomonas putida]|uniref:Uncharacterized protein n=1 Tax=Pseudomonas putida TaxID=303 RepID=A0A2S3WQ90_PSEPU|nr:hypothetical protein BGP82_20185 [Pseudomonas putida]
MLSPQITRMRSRPTEFLQGDLEILNGSVRLGVLLQPFVQHALNQWNDVATIKGVIFDLLQLVYEHWGANRQ